MINTLIPVPLRKCQKLCRPKCITLCYILVTQCPTLILVAHCHDLSHTVQRLCLHCPTVYQSPPESTDFTLCNSSSTMVTTLFNKCKHCIIVLTIRDYIKNGFYPARVRMSGHVNTSMSSQQQEKEIQHSQLMSPPETDEYRKCAPDTWATTTKRILPRHPDEVQLHPCPMKCGRTFSKLSSAVNHAKACSGPDPKRRRVETVTLNPNLEIGATDEILDVTPIQPSKLSIRYHY